MTQVVTIQSRTNRNVQTLRKAFATVLTKHIKQSGLEIEDVAGQIGVSPVPFYLRFIKGGAAISLEILHDICAVIKVSPESIVSEVYEKVGRANFRRNIKGKKSPVRT